MRLTHYFFHYTKIWQLIVLGFRCFYKQKNCVFKSEASNYIKQKIDKNQCWRLLTNEPFWILSIFCQMILTRGPLFFVLELSFLKMLSRMAFKALYKTSKLLGDHCLTSKNPKIQIAKILPYSSVFDLYGLKAQFASIGWILESKRSK